MLREADVILTDTHHDRVATGELTVAMLEVDVAEGATVAVEAQPVDQAGETPARPGSAAGAARSGVEGAADRGAEHGDDAGHIFLDGYERGEKDVEFFLAGIRTSVEKAGMVTFGLLGRP